MAGFALPSFQALFRNAIMTAFSLFILASIPGVNTFLMGGIGQFTGKRPAA